MGKRLAGEKHNKNIFQNLKNVYGFYPLKFQKSAKFIHLNDVKSKIIGLSVRSIRDRARLKGIDIRFPFLSKDLIELSLCTPEKYKLKKELIDLFLGIVLKIFFQIAFIKE